MSCGHGRGSRRLRGNRSLRCRRRSSRPHRRLGRLGYSRAWRGRNLGWLRGRNGYGLGNRNRRSCRRGLCFDCAGMGRGRAAWLGDNGCVGRWNHCRRWRGRRRRGLHARCSGGRVFRGFIRYGLLFRLGFRFGQGAKMLAHFYSGFHFDRTGMRFFLGNAGLGQIINDGLGLDLEFASQFVDSDLIRIGHCPPGRLLVSVLV